MRYRKIKIIMKNLILLLLGLLTISSCSTRSAYTTGAAAGGAGIGYLASDGNPLATIGGAAGGALASELIQGQAEKGRVAQYNRGYDRGAADQAKNQYWMTRNLHDSKNESNKQPTEKRVLIPIKREAQTIDGVEVDESVEYLPVVE